MKRILNRNNGGFVSEHAAKIMAGKYHLETFTIVPYQDGYAIETPEDISPEEGAKKSNPTWKPATLLDIPAHLKNPRFVYRFCNMKADGNIDKKIAEGWEIDHEISRLMSQPKPTVQDGAALDTTTKIRELIVMRMPKEMAEARSKYFAGLTDGAMQRTADQLKKDLMDAAGEYDDSPEYGDIKVETY